MRLFFRQHGLYFSWLIALIATLLSLYLSILEALPVCELCWYQRICMYPLAIILGIAAYRDDRMIALYTLPLAILGLLLSLYQYLEQMIPSFSWVHLCGAGTDCSKIHLQWFGFVTLPFLGLVANVIIIILLALTYENTCRSKD